MFTEALRSTQDLKLTACIMYVAFPSCMAGTASIGANKLLNLFIALEYYVHLLQKVQNLLRKYVINISGI